MENKFDKVFIKEKGFLMYCIVAALIVMIAQIIMNKEIPAIIGIMLWTSIVGVAVMRVIKAAVEELKNK